MHELMVLAQGGNGALGLAGLVLAICTGGGLTALISWLANRGKNSAEEAEIWTKASVTRLKSMHEEVTSLDEQVKAINQELRSEREARRTAEHELEVERQARLRTIEKLEAAVRLLSAHNIDYNGILAAKDDPAG